MEKLAALKAKEKKNLGAHPSLWIMPFLFLVKLEIIKYIGQSSENWLEAGGKSVWKYCDI